MASEPTKLITVLASAALVAGAAVATGVGEAQAATAKVASFADVVPAPATAQPASGVTFTLSRTSKIFSAPGSAEIGRAHV